MDTPDFPVMKNLCDVIKNASFKVKTRGYSPKEVDEFMDLLVEKLLSVDNKLESIQQYEKWLRVEAHGQVMTKAQQEALRIMQEAQDKAKNLMESTQADMERDKAEFQEKMDRFAQEWATKKESMEEELAQLREYVDDYRVQAIRTLEESLVSLQTARRQEEQDVSCRSLTHGYTAQVNSAEDVNKFIEELKKQLRT